MTDRVPYFLTVAVAVALGLMALWSVKIAVTGHLHRLPDAPVSAERAP